MLENINSSKSIALVRQMSIDSDMLKENHKSNMNTEVEIDTSNIYIDESVVH